MRPQRSSIKVFIVTAVLGVMLSSCCRPTYETYKLGENDVVRIFPDSSFMLINGDFPRAVGTTDHEGHLGGIAGVWRGSFQEKDTLTFYYNTRYGWDFIVSGDSLIEVKQPAKN